MNLSETQILNSLHVPQKWYRKLIMYTIEVSVVIISILLIVMTYRTFADFKPPIILNELAVVTTVPVASDDMRTAHEVHITQDVTFTDDDASVVINTQLINKDMDASLDLLDTKLATEHRGTFKTHKLHYVSHLAPGHWCIKNTETWTPFLSLRERTIVTPESCFDVR